MPLFTIVYPHQAEASGDEELMNTVSEMTNTSWHGLLAALSLLLDAAQDETARELILKSHQDFTSLCGALGIGIARDAFITALCKASLPPHYDLLITGTKSAEVCSNNPNHPNVTHILFHNGGSVGQTSPSSLIRDPSPPDIVFLIYLPLPRKTKAW